MYRFPRRLHGVRSWWNNDMNLSRAMIQEIWAKSWAHETIQTIMIQAKEKKNINHYKPFKLYGVNATIVAWVQTSLSNACVITEVYDVSAFPRCVAIKARKINFGWNIHNIKTWNTFLYRDITQTKVYISCFQHLTAEKKKITSDCILDNHSRRTKRQEKLKEQYFSKLYGLPWWCICWSWSVDCSRS